MSAVAMRFDEAEAAAVRAAVEGRLWARVRIAVRALHRLAQDPTRLDEVLLLNIALNAGRLPGLLAQVAAAPEGIALLHDRPTIDRAAVAQLRGLDEDTLGGAYVRFVDDNGLDPDVFRAPPGMPEVAAYLAQRQRQTHDLWHVLTGYAPDVPGELSLLGFTYAQTGMPGIGLLAWLGALRHGFRYPGLVGAVRRGYRRGKRAQFLPAIRWERLWQRPLAEVRAELGID